jgi:TetR/AcrR family transcriptional repressor of nem operon
MARPKAFDRTRAVSKALDVFWCKGYEATSVQDLLVAMGINRGSMYDTFHDKYSLYVEALERYAQIETERLFSILDEDITGYAAIERFFSVIIDDLVNDKHRRGCFVVNTIIELAPHDDTLHQRVAAILDWIEAGFERTIRRGQHDGSINITVNPGQTARLLNNTMQGLRVIGKVTAHRERLQDITSTALHTLR